MARCDILAAAHGLPDELTIGAPADRSCALIPRTDLRNVNY